MLFAATQRPRKVAVSSQRDSSQPATFGGWNSIWPAMSEIQVQSSSTMP